MADKTFRWFAGVDWGSAKHQACLLDEAGTVVGERGFAQGGAGLAALCDWLVSIAGEAGRVAVAIEVPHGPVVDALLDRGFAVHAINPKQLERLRDRVSLAGAKDDRRDARVAAGGLRTDPHLFRPVEAGDPAVIALREWSRLAEELQAGARAPGQPHPSAALALLPAAARGERRRHRRMGPGPMDTSTHPGPGRTPARGDAGPAAPGASDPQVRCRAGAQHLASARDHGGRRRHRSRGAASALAGGPPAPSQPRVPPGGAQTG